MVEQTLQGGRRAIEGQCKLLTHYSYGQIDGLHPTQYIGHQVAALEAFRVPAIRHFIVRRSVHVVEDRTGQPAPGQFAEVTKVMTVAQAHSKTSFVVPRAKYQLERSSYPERTVRRGPTLDDVLDTALWFRTRNDMGGCPEGSGPSLARHGLSTCSAAHCP